MKFSRSENRMKPLISLSKAAIFFRIESKINDEMGQFGEFILELVKAAFSAGAHIWFSR
jgi:hypothetical protein